MKKILFVMMAILMSVSTSSFAGTTTWSSESESVQKITIPTKIIIKQIITFNDGSSVEVFYQKDGKTCKLYSNTDIKAYKASDLNRIKSTSFDITDHVEGKCRMTKTTSNIIELAKSLFKQLS